MDFPPGSSSSKPVPVGVPHVTHTSSSTPSTASRIPAPPEWIGREPGAPARDATKESPQKQTPQKQKRTLIGNEATRSSHIPVPVTPVPKIKVSGAGSAGGGGGEAGAGADSEGSGLTVNEQAVGMDDTGRR